MATYIKDLVEDNGDITRPVTEAGAVLLSGGGDLETTLASKADQTVVDNKISVGDVQSTDIVANAVTTAKIADGAVTAAKTNLTTFKNNSNVADSFGWTYIGQTIITSPNADIKFTSPTKYDNYKVVICAALSAGSSTWVDVRMLDGATNLYNYHHVQQASGTSFSAGTNSNVIYCANGPSLNKYDGIDAEVNIYGAGSNWVKFHGIFCAGQNGAFLTRIFNGRNTSATKPDTFELITGGTFNTGSWIKVWGSNN